MILFVFLEERGRGKSSLPQFWCLVCRGR